MLFSALERASDFVRRTSLAVQNNLVAGYIEANAGIRVIALHQFRSIVLNVVGSESELESHTIGALGSSRTKRLIFFNPGLDILCNTEAVFSKVCGKAIGRPVRADDRHRVAVIAD